MSKFDGGAPESIGNEVTVPDEGQAGVLVQGHAREEALRLMSLGAGRNMISRQTGLSTATVSRLAQEVGHSFAARAMTRVATKTRIADLQMAKLEIAERLVDEVNKALVDIGSAETSRDYANVAKAINDFMRSIEIAEPKEDLEESNEEGRDKVFLLYEMLVDRAQKFEAETGLSLRDPESKERYEQWKENQNEQP